MPYSFAISAPGKINLHLRVGPLSSDGFHPLMTWMTTVGLYDSIRFDWRVAPHPKPSFMLRCPPGIPADASNLVARAIFRICPESKLVDPAMADLFIDLEKHIPAGGGMGGGSSNAACVLISINHQLQLGYDLNSLANIAAALGSDVPFFLGTPSAQCSGRGEHIFPIEPPAPRAAVLIFPPFALSTAAVYRQFDLMKLGAGNLSNPLDWSTLTTLDAADLLETLINDLELPAFALNPSLSQLASDAASQFRRPVRMSGSGSTLFTLFDNLDEARLACDHAAIRDCVVRAVEVAPTPNA